MPDKPSLPAIRVVIFDMDGLMVDTEPVWVASWEPAFVSRGLPVYPELVEACKGLSAAAAAQRVARAYDDNPLAQEAFYDHYRIAEEIFVSFGARKKRGLDDLLRMLARRGVACAVASSSPRRVVTAMLRHARVSDFFSVVVTGDDGYASKPDPAIFLAAARALHASPAETLVIEDSIAGVRAAIAGGFRVSMVPDSVSPNVELASSCSLVAESLVEVGEWLAEGLLE